MRFKKSLIIIILVLLSTAAWSLTWETANQKTIGWDAVQYDIDPAGGERLIYRAYLANAKTDPNKQNPAFIGETTDLQILVTLTDKGSYFFGVKTVIQVEQTIGAGDWEEVAGSEVTAWSDDPTYAQAGATFGLRFYPAPAAPAGIRPVTQ